MTIEMMRMDMPTQAHGIADLCELALQRSYRGFVLVSFCSERSERLEPHAAYLRAINGSILSNGRFELHAVCLKYYQMMHLLWSCTHALANHTALD